MARTRVRRTLLAVVFGALGLLAYHASATFTTAATATRATDTGDMDVVLGGEGTTDNRLTIAATLAPGQSAQRQANLSVVNDGETMDAVTLSTTATGTPPNFFTDTDEGMTLWIARCSEPWTEVGSSPDFTYTCGETQLDVLGTSAAPVPLSQTQAGLSNLVLADDSVNHLRVEIAFPADAPPSMFDESADIEFTFAGGQRSGSAR